MADNAAESNEVVEETTNETEEVEIDPLKRDLLWALTKPIEEMTLEEQLEAVQRIRELRKVKLTVKKTKSGLDMLLDQLTPEKAASLLKQLEALMTKTEEQS